MLFIRKESEKRVTRPSEAELLIHMFEVEKKSLGDLDSEESDAAISFLAFDSAWEDILEVDPPDWLEEWSSLWKCDLLWDWKIGDGDQFRSTGYLVRDDSNRQNWFSNMEEGYGESFQPFIKPTGEVSSGDVCDFTFKYWADILGESFLDGALTIGDHSWLPKKKTKRFVEDFLKREGLGHKCKFDVTNWLNRAYGEASQ